jgi:hypothetical protein
MSVEGFGVLPGCVIWELRQQAFHDWIVSGPAVEQDHSNLASGWIEVFTGLSLQESRVELARSHSSILLL